LGVLLFLILHRTIVLAYLFLEISNYSFFASDMPYFQILAIEYVSLMLFLFFGAWYGIWIGQHWYKNIYEEKSYEGVVKNVISSLFIRSKKTKDLARQIQILSEDLNRDSEKIFQFSKKVKVRKSTFENEKKLKK
jgi:hypothetical protein